jgi:5-methylthioadenosine/S-adenosylhomocysteine deaminase
MPNGTQDSGRATVVRADWVLTVDDADRVLTDGAVAFVDGVLTGVGPADEVLAAHPGAEVVDLPGHALLPGLVNAHTHLAMTMFRGYADDRDLQGFLDTVLPAEQRVLTADRVRAATRAAAVESVLAGTTTALDMYFFTDGMLAGAADAGLRLQTGPIFLDAAGPEGWEWEERLARAEAWLDANPAGPGFRPVLQPHATYTVSPEHLAAVGRLAERYGAAVHVHASENEGEVGLVNSRYGRRPLQVLDDCGLLRSGTVLAHAVWLDDDEVARIADTGTAVAHCPGSNLKLASGVARVSDLHAAGATVGIGTDGPASSNDLDVLAAARLAALLHKGAAPSVGGNPRSASTLPAPLVLRMATAGGAAAVGLGGQIGSLTVGHRADVVAIDLDQPHTQPVYDPVSAVVYAAGRRDVRQVWIDGACVVRDGRSVRVDHATVVADLKELQGVVRPR